MTTVAIIPARMGSSRVPGKPLAPLMGRPMIEHVYRRTAMSETLSGVHVATCDEAIRETVEAFGGTAIMTSDRHERASDRIAEAYEGELRSRMVSGTVVTTDLGDFVEMFLEKWDE